MYEDGKIRHLGSALINFVHLKSLDLSNNALVSVQVTLGLNPGSCFYAVNVFVDVASNSTILNCPSLSRLYFVLACLRSSLEPYDDIHRNVEIQDALYRCLMHHLHPTFRHIWYLWKAKLKCWEWKFCRFGNVGMGFVLTDHPHDPRVTLWKHTPASLHPSLPQTSHLFTSLCWRHHRQKTTVTLLWLYLIVTLAWPLFKTLMFLVQGVQYLKVLERLILYRNCIPSLEEVEVLYELPALRELDLRLNPLTKSHPHYRPHLVHAMPSLRKLGKT